MFLDRYKQLDGCYVYIHTRADQEPSDDHSVFYVGMGRKRRAWDKRSNPFWKSVASKHGFAVWIVEHGLTDGDACELERQVIESYAANGVRLANMTMGGEGVKYLSDDAKERKRIGISKAKAGKPISEALKSAISRALKGRKLTDAHRAKLSAAAKSCRSHLQSQHSRNAGMAYAKPVECVETGARHNSTRAAARWLIDIGHDKAIHRPITLVCTGRAKSAYGFRWRYIQEKSPE